MQEVIEIGSLIRWKYLKYNDQGTEPVAASSTSINFVFVTSFSNSFCSLILRASSAILLTTLSAPLRLSDLLSFKDFIELRSGPVRRLTTDPFEVL